MVTERLSGHRANLNNFKSVELLVGTGPKWVYIFDWKKPKKLIPIDYLRNSKVAARNFLTRPKTTL
jgi:hypothetical protein